MLTLTDEELEMARFAMGCAGCARRVTQEGPSLLVADWANFVKRCEAGYSGGLAEFLQDLSVRTVLHRVLARLPERLRTKIEGEVLPLDYRYRAIPKRTDDFLLPHRFKERHDPDRFFWLYGVPVNCRLES